MKISTRFLAEKEWEVRNESGNLLPVDMYPEGEKKAFSPMQLVLAATGACAAVDIVQILKKKRKTVLDLRIESEGTRREELPRRFTHLHLHFILYSPNTSSEELEKVVALAIEKYCSVSASLAADIELKYTAEVLEQLS
ncbi:OsmC family protein [Nafulsella turpanensis]|uniref:OsmC family protein n=1 Tax=Nafulsella turpanensis TaxID=1265690 RepID=UPI00034633B4|nr:OsmC family protein [Nafulsella turpanensis]